MGKRDLKKYFTPNYTFQPNPLRTVTVEVIEEHNLQVGDAGLGIRDLSDPTSCLLIDAAIESGSYPILISLIQSVEKYQLTDGSWHSSNDSYIGAVKLYISTQPVKIWKQAKLIEQGTKKATSRLSIDSGWAGIFDIAVMKEAKGTWDERLLELSADYTMRTYYPPTSPRVVGVSSGYGDGQYPCYLGYDKKEELSAIVLDFDCFPNEKSRFFDYSSLEGSDEYEQLGLWIRRLDRWRSVPLDAGAYALKIVCDGTQIVGKAHPILIDDHGRELELSSERIETTDSGKYLTLVKFPTIERARKISCTFTYKFL